MSEQKYTLNRDGHGLTANEREVLTEIAVLRPLSYEKIGAHLGCNKQRVNQIVQNLEAKGFIAKKEVYVFTAKGVKTFDPTKAD